MNKYIEVSKTDIDAKKENEWFKYCELNQTPFITVKPRLKYADVSWDYISYSKEIESILERLGTTLRDSAIDIFKKYANAKSSYTANGRLVSFKNLELDKAHSAASELYDLVAESAVRSNP